MLALVALHAVMAAMLPWWGRRLGRGVWFAAALPPSAAVVWAAVLAPGVLGGSPVEERLDWAPSLGLSLDMRLDALSLLMVWIVSGVGAVVLVYSAHYYPERDAGREAALLLAFAGAMVGLVAADNLFALYVFWELTTVVSFLLIAGRGRHRERRRAAEQALLMTAVGGLAMLLGFVMLGQAAGSYRISELVADPPSGGSVPVAVVLILIGVFAKSAQMPLHGWLPAAMVAPTPVSAYLHAAAMVKAGVYLVARLAPGFAEVEPWRPMLFTVGLLSMVLGAWRALRETDLKMLLAYGTVSELGMLLVLLGAGTRTAALAGAVMLLAHAAFKATLFLVTGILEHRTGTRDLRELSGVGRAMPGVFAVAALAAASMANLPPLIAFLGKEAAYEAFLHGGGIGGHGFVTAGLFLGSVLTVAYTARFLWGAFARKPGREPATQGPPAAGFLAPPALLAAAGLLLGLWYKATAVPVSAYADGYPPGPDGPYKLALWHGLTPVLGLSALTILLGAMLHWGDRGRLSGGTAPWKRLPRLPDTQGGYRRIVHGAELLALRVARHTQVGSLPAYVVVLLLTVLVLPGVALALAGPSFDRPRLWTSAAQLPLALVVLTAAVAVTTTRHRLTGVLLAGAVGYGVAGLFLVRGAPDLALVQFLVESLTLVVIVLVLRRMPPRFTPARSTLRIRSLQVTVAVAIGAFVGLFAMAAASARRAEPVSKEHLERVEEAGAHNAVNAIIVEFRALDTLGEIAVLLVTVLGAVSLVRIWRGSEPMARPDGTEAPGAPEPGADEPGAHEPEAAHEAGGPAIHPSPSPAAHWDAPREGWLPGAGERPGGERSVLLEVATRVFFPSLLVLSLYLLLSGHHHPGGGFAAGLVAGLAYVLRYLVGGRADLANAAPVDPAVVAGGGLALAALVGALPIAFGAEPLASTVVSAQLPVIGTLKFATSVFFDVGVYFLVVGIALKLLSALGVGLSPEETQRAAGESELS